MSNLLDSNAASTPTTTPTANTSSTAGTSGSFPSGGDTSSTSATLANQILSLSPAQFAADYGVTSSELPTYIDQQTGKLNANAVDLAWYFSLTQSERQSIQNAMVETGTLSATDATGENNTAAADAFKSLIGETS